ncbi:hypothetical protein B0H13DRAFT_1912969 [Mycena leptocephala]|nr:hypothetical protein B0H13DRAFT_1912969 [Mycena leptocephala]
MFELAKNSFRNLKKQWNEVQKIEVAIQGDTNRRTNRHLKRRQRKSQKLTKILYTFAAKHGLGPGCLADLLHGQFLSDEASRPEDDSIEGKEAWKVPLASAAGLLLDPKAQQKTKILEILTPAWRSESYSCKEKSHVRSTPKKGNLHSAGKETQLSSSSRTRSHERLQTIQLVNTDLSKNGDPTARNITISTPASTGGTEWQPQLNCPPQMSIIYNGLFSNPSKHYEHQQVRTNGIDIK